MHTVKTWQERKADCIAEFPYSDAFDSEHMEAEIDELRAALKAAPSTSQLTDWDIAADMEVADAKWADADVPLGWAKHFARAIELKIKGGE